MEREHDIELTSLNHQKVPFIQLSLLTDPKSIIGTLNNAINEKYNLNKSFLNLLITPSLPEKDMFSLLKFVDGYCINTKTLFTSIAHKLYKKNNFFTKTIDYFTECGCKNIQNVTADTLDIINDSNAPQPIEQLNKLSLIIKQYIMSRAWNSIETSYTVEFKHPQPIYIYSICLASHKIIIHSTDKNLHLWDFNSGKKIDVFPEKTYLSALSFNNDGSLFATSSYYDNDKSLIKIWQTASKKTISTFSQDHFVYHLKFLENSSDNVLAMFLNNNNEIFLNVCTFDNNMKPVYVGTIPSTEKSMNCNKYDSYKNYEVSFSDDDRSILYLTKKTCPELYLCKQAMKNGIQTDASFIYKSKTHAQLTEFEEKIFKEKISEKTSLLILPKKKSITL